MGRQTSHYCVNATLCRAAEAGRYPGAVEVRVSADIFEELTWMALPDGLMEQIACVPELPASTCICVSIPETRIP